MKLVMEMEFSSNNRHRGIYRTTICIIYLHYIFASVGIKVRDLDERALS